MKVEIEQERKLLQCKGTQVSKIIAGKQEKIPLVFVECLLPQVCCVLGAFAVGQHVTGCFFLA